ncbi:hypothetical protein HGRIS_001868 [Hohenbuehelia grisea]|uniref:Uncharacterized protein n=1 Tax=Hohenbuehelia grisea TaxID=104357 RepID=A0ABR3JJI2_9AGAR
MAQISHFHPDDSADGIVVLNGPPISDNDSHPSVKFSVQRWIAHERSSTAVHPEIRDVYFVQCTLRTSVFFIKLEELKRRVGGSQGNLLDVYESDWSRGHFSPACAGWLPDGEEIVVGNGPTGWPRGIIAPKESKHRYAIQLEIWTSIASNIEQFTTSGRLWSPKDHIDPPWKVYFVPMHNWLSEADLQAVLDLVTAEEVKKNKNMNLTSWLQYRAISRTVARTGRVDGIRITHVSQNLLGLFETYMSVDDRQKMIEAQTNGRDVERVWFRPNPQEKMAVNFDNDLKTRKSPISGKLLHTTVTTLTPVDNIRAPAINDGSANEWAKFVWRDRRAGQVAEWLHRSAYCLGKMTLGNYQSSDNIVFGTHEARNTMARSENLIRLVLAQTDAVFGPSKGAKGTLRTSIVDQGQVYYSDEMGRPARYDFEELTQERLSWLAPVLQYSGEFNFSEMKSMTAFAGPAPVWDTRFFTLSLYTPLAIEGLLDSLLWEKYFSIHFPGGKPSRKHRANNPARNITRDKLPEGFLEPETVVLESQAFAVSVEPPTLMPISPFDTVSSVAMDVTSQGDLPAEPPKDSPPSNDSAASAPHFIANEAYQNERSASSVKASKIATHPLHVRAWRAATQHKDQVDLGGVLVSKPSVDGSSSLPSESPDGPTPPPGGFVLTGTIKLFGLDKDAVLKSWHGPPPPHVVLGKDLPIYQEAVVNSIFASDFIPFLRYTRFTVLEFKQVTVTRQNYDFDPTKPLGWSMSATIDIDKDYGMVHDILAGTLQVPKEKLTLQVTAALGLNLAWGELPSMSTFSVEGILGRPSDGKAGQKTVGFPLGKGVTLNRIGVRLTGVRDQEADDDDKKETEEAKEMQYGFSIFGDMHVEVPASKQPLELDFEIKKADKKAELHASSKGDMWKNAFGTGLNLESIGLNTSLTPKHPLEDLTFDIQAEFNSKKTTAVFSGSYTPEGKYKISAKVSDFGVDGVLNLFRHYAGNELSLPSHIDVEIGSATITISKEAGLEVEVEDVKYHEYKAKSAKIELSSKGLTVEGKIDNVTFPNVPITLEEASLRISFEKVKSKKSTDVALAGAIKKVGDLNLPHISAAVHLYKTSESNTLDWTVYGRFDELPRNPSLGSVFHQLQGSFLENVALEDVLFIAASKDDPLLSDMNPQKFEVSKGVQICAGFGKVDSFGKLMRRDTPALTLKAGYASEKGLFLGVDVPDDTMIHLGKGITTDPIELEIDLRPVSLSISAGIKVPVPKNTEPLEFKAELKLSAKTVDIQGEMIGVWKDPFGVSKDVSVGPDLALVIGIILPEFVVSGIPEKIGFQGALDVGKVNGKVGVQISEDPTQELLSGELKNLTIIDVVSFARQITMLHIPDPPDFIDFEKIKLYMSTGVTIASVEYPAGVSFEADIKIFDTSVNAAAEITTSGLTVKGSTHNLKVGPLTIEGHDGKDAILDLEVSATTQKLLVDGMIKLFDDEVSLLLDLEILPSPKFQFDFVLHFTRLLTFEVDAAMIGTTNLKDLGNLDFTLHALFEQHLVEYVRDQVLAALEQAKKKASGDIDAAKAEVSAQEKKQLEGIAAAQATVNTKHAEWLAKSKQVHDEFDTKTKEYLAALKGFQHDVDAQKQKFNLDLKAAESNVQLANAARAKKMRDAEAAVTKAKTDLDNNVAEKEKKLEQAKVDFNRQFGNAEQDITNAEAKVEKLQHQIDDINRSIRECEDASGWEFWKKGAIPGLYIELGSVHALKAIADGVLKACNGVLEAAEYTASKGLITAAELALADVQKVGDEGLTAAKAAVVQFDSDTRHVMDVANKALEVIQHGGDDAWHAAEKALDAFVAAQKPILAAAQKAVDDLLKSAEWLAYQSATAALTLAKHVTHGMEVAKKALDVVEKAEEGVLNLAEELVTGGLGAFDIKKIELKGTLKALLGTSNKHFTATIDTSILGQPATFVIDLDMGNTSTFIHELFKQVLYLPTPVGRVE